MPQGFGVDQEKVPEMGELPALSGRNRSSKQQSGDQPSSMMASSQSASMARRPEAGETAIAPRHSKAASHVQSQLWQAARSTQAWVLQWPEFQILVGPVCLLAARAMESTQTQAQQWRAARSTPAHALSRVALLIPGGSVCPLVAHAMQGT